MNTVSLILFFCVWRLKNSSTIWQAFGTRQIWRTVKTLLQEILFQIKKYISKFWIFLICQQRGRSIVLGKKPKDITFPQTHAEFFTSYLNNPVYTDWNDISFRIDTLWPEQNGQRQRRHLTTQYAYCILLLVLKVVVLTGHAAPSD